MEKRTDILNRIISKGGLFGSAAKMYINDNVKADRFIIECFEQCDNASSISFWGKDLVADIIEYNALQMQANNRQAIYNNKSLIRRKAKGKIKHAFVVQKSEFIETI